MKKIFLSFLLLSGICVAQNPVIKLANLEQKARVLNDLKYSVDGIEGHQYFLDDWGTGKIIINDSINAPQARIQFDMVSGEPILGNSAKEKKGFILRDNSVTGFVINNTKFIKISKDNFLNEIDKKYFVTPMFSKNNYLIIAYSKVLKEPYILNNGYNKTDSNKRYVSIKRFYLLNKDSKYVQVKLKKKDILKALSDKEKEVKKYVKSNKLNLKKEKDVVDILDYYHSL